MNNNPIGWPDSAFGYNSSTQTLTAPTVAATKAVTVNAPSSYTGNLLDLQSGGASKVKLSSAGTAQFGPYPSQVSYLYIGQDGAIRDFIIGTNSGGGPGPFITLYGWGGVKFQYTNYELGACATSDSWVWRGTHKIGWASGDPSSTTMDLMLRRDAANILAQYNGTNAQAYRVYNTYTSATNYERGKLEWSGNVFNVGTEKGSGGGTARSMALQTDATDRLTLDTVGSVRVTTGLTVATLPASPTVGMIARVTNALSPIIGSTVAGGGAANALCWYNGTNWTVLGI